MRNAFLTRVANATNEFIKVLRFGKSDVQTSVQANAFGIDSKPIAGINALQLLTSEVGNTFIIGYTGINIEKTESGETRLYSTDDDGNVVFDIYLKKDGTCEIGGDSDFMVRFSKLKTGFDSLKTDFNNHITKYNAHVHTETGVTTTPPVVSDTPTTASIDDSKIANIKTN